MAARRISQEAQPRTYLVSVKNVLSLPFRICNPPPAIGKVRSCGVTPLYKIRLDDVLDRQHLPPLGLKDFEEWLLFVELSPENLYFVLWLWEYRQRYEQWRSELEFQAKKAPSGFPINWSGRSSTHLAMFYQRAKQTFFTPGSAYELNLSSSLLAPFHQESSTPYPDPRLFVPVELETRRMLDESLRRFVTAQFNNVGNKRVLCGIIAGIFIVLLGTVPALTLSFILAQDRWPRLAAFPGMWIGLTIVISALNGICIGVYIFGDLRQLRKFELARPTISKPQPLPLDTQRIALPQRPESANSILPLQTPGRKFSSPGHILHDRHTLTSPSRASGLTVDTIQTAGSSMISEDNGIEISPAYYDADELDPSGMYEDYTFPPVEGRAANEPIFNRDVNGNALANDRDSISSYMVSTATFIHPWEFAEDTDEAAHRHPERHQKVETFDFDSLPRRALGENRSRSRFRSSAPTPTLSEPQPARSQSRHPGATHMANFSNSSSSQSPSPISPTLNGSFTNPHTATHTPSPLPSTPPPMNLLKLKLPDPRSAPPSQRPKSLLARFQERCGIARWRLQPGFLESAEPYSEGAVSKTGSSQKLPPLESSSYWVESPHGISGMEKGRSARVRAGDERVMGWSSSRASLSGTSMQSVGVPSSQSTLSDESARAKKARKRFKMINAVPPFAVPLTKVLSPVVVRGQWEIVVRSAAIAFLLSWVVIGGLLAVPVVAR